MSYRLSRVDASDPSAGSLSPRLDEILARIRNRQFADRMRKVLLSAAHAIHRMADIDLVKYETASIEGTPDLSMWEEMAPVIRDTVVDVNELLMTIREQFPAAAASAPPGPAAGPADVRHELEAEQVFGKACRTLADEVSNLGNHMRSPAVVADRWNLLADLENFRSRFRSLIGEMVFDAASAFDEAHRKDVVPFYKNEIDTAVVVRGTVADLRRVMVSRQDQVREAMPEDVQWNAQQMERELDIFGKTPAYRSMRAQDKKILLEFRAQLRQSAARSNLTREEFLADVVPFVTFVQSLAAVNRRELLLQHDREVSAACGVALEKATALAPSAPDAAAAILTDAVARAQALYGRDAELDTFLRRSRKAGQESAADVQQRIEQLAALLANLSLF